MSQEMIMAVIALVSGGGLTALCKAIFDHNKVKQNLREQDVDDRILAWQKISDKNESRIEVLEHKLETYDRDFRSLERYIGSLEQTILRAGIPEMPDRPLLEIEKEIK